MAQACKNRTDHRFRVSGRNPSLCDERGYALLIAAARLRGVRGVAPVLVALVFALPLLVRGFAARVLVVRVLAVWGLALLRLATVAEDVADTAVAAAG